MLERTSVPLVIDLDGTLLNTDLLAETFFERWGRHPHHVVNVVGWLARGKAVLKRRLAERAMIDPRTLPYNQAVVDRALEARQAGRAVYLASAADALLVQAIADHLGCFDGWFASDGVSNLSGGVKADVLAGQFGDRGFDYVGNDTADLAVWRRARTAILVNAGPSVIRRLDAERIPHETLISRHLAVGEWIKLVRPVQWTKNALVFIPLLTAHLWTIDAALQCLLAFVAFSLCASGGYVLNDLVDFKADRQHPAKRKRPFANGTVSMIWGPAVALALVGGAFAVASLLPPLFVAILAAYLVLTLVYSLYLKRKLMIDAVVLAALYTARVMAGAAAISVAVSEWLLAFSVFAFFSLALLKRYSELALRFDAGLPDPDNRDYRVGDLSVISSLAAASSFSAVIVFSLYLSSDTVSRLYAHPQVLWLVCPLLIYWFSRLLMLSHRRVLHDDPLVFALKDPISLGIVGAVLLVGALAS